MGFSSHMSVACLQCRFHVFCYHFVFSHSLMTPPPATPSGFMLTPLPCVCQNIFQCIHQLGIHLSLPPPQGLSPPPALIPHLPCTDFEYGLEGHPFCHCRLLPVNVWLYVLSSCHLQNALGILPPPCPIPLTPRPFPRHRPKTPCAPPLYAST